MNHLSKKPRSVSDTKRHAVETILAAIGDERSPPDVIRMNRNLPVRGGDVGRGNEAGSSKRIQVAFEDGHGPRLANEQRVDRTAIIYAEVELTILAGNDGDWRSSGARLLSRNTAGNHLFIALVNGLLLTGIGSIRRDVNGFCASRERKSCVRSFAFS